MISLTTNLATMGETYKKMWKTHGETLENYLHALFKTQGSHRDMMIIMDDNSLTGVDVRK